MNLCKNCGISGMGDVIGSPVDWSNPDYNTPTDILGVSYPSTINTSTATFNPSIISNIAGAFSSIFKTLQPLPAGCTVVAGPYGQSTACSGTGTNPLSLNMAGNVLGGSSSMLLLAGAALLLVMMMKK
jgi:hypothetical protein